MWSTSLPCTPDSVNLPTFLSTSINKPAMDSTTAPVVLLHNSFFFFSFFFSGFSTGLVQLYIAGLPLRSCRTIGAPSVQGSTQCAFFSFLVAAGFEPSYFSLGIGHLNHYPILTPIVKVVSTLLWSISKSRRTKQYQNENQC